MKIINSLIICLCMAISSLSMSVDPDPQEIPIKGRNGDHNNLNRDLPCYCTAYYYSSSSTLEVNTYDIGAAAIVLFDGNDHVVATDFVTGVGTEQVQLAVPSRSGEYRVEISSSVYDGVGYLIK